MINKYFLIYTSRVAALCLMLVIYGISPAVIAGEVNGLYEAEVPVKSQSDVERGNALNAALVEVLTKVSGNRDVNSIAALEPVLSHPMGLVQQFRYRQSPVESQQSTQPQAANVVTAPVTQILWVSFDAQAVNQALNNAGLPVWGRARPSTLVWLAVEDKNVRYLVGGDSHDDIQDLIRQDAQRRGIPVLIPLLDLDDETNLHFADVWGNFQETIFKASDRYQAEAVLVGRLYRRADNSWQARWSLYVKNDNQNWELATNQTEAAIAAGIDGSADILSAKFSKVISEVGSTSIRISIKNVNTLEDYARIMKYLRSLDPITQLQVEEVSSSGIMLNLGIRSDRTELEQVIGFGSTLAPSPPDVNAPINNSTPAFQTPATTKTLYYRLLQ